MDAKIINHYGKWINSEEPTTGVLSINEIQWEWLDFGTCLTCKEVMENIQNDDSLTEEEKESELEWLECDSSHTRIHGDWLQDSDGKYYPDESGEFSMIENESTCQVVWSKSTKRGNPCSPCYPGQVEFSNEGEFLAYTLPNDLLYHDED